MTLFQKQDPQIIEIKENTVVNHNIIFESQLGEIHIFDNSSINGKVLGAKIIRK
jgi:hypothetical protein